jgi:hypothetical protein
VPTDRNPSCVLSTVAALNILFWNNRPKLNVMIFLRHEHVAFSVVTTLQGFQEGRVYELNQCVSLAGLFSAEYFRA